MTMAQFIDKHRESIDNVIGFACPADFDIDDTEREMWVYNDEWLYTLAVDENVEDI